MPKGSAAEYLRTIQQNFLQCQKYSIFLYTMTNSHMRLLSNQNVANVSGELNFQKNI